ERRYRDRPGGNLQSSVTASRLHFVLAIGGSSAPPLDCRKTRCGTCSSTRPLIARGAADPPKRALPSPFCLSHRWIERSAARLPAQCAAVPVLRRVPLIARGAADPPKRALPSPFCLSHRW